jgi:hypothetical protein
MTRLSGPRASASRRAFLTNATVLAGATLALALTPATVSFPIAVTEALVLAGGAATAMVLNLVLLPRAGRPEPGPSRVPREPQDMAAATPVAVFDRARAPRMLVSWAAPRQLADAEAEAWASAELRQVLQAERIDMARLARLRPASPRYADLGDWLLELDVPPGPAARAVLEERPWAEWLDDLGLLGLRPAAAVVDRGRLLTGAED